MMCFHAQGKDACLINLNANLNVKFCRIQIFGLRSVDPVDESQRTEKIQIHE